MYHDHFKLREPPFSIAPDPSYLYLSAHHQEALGHLLYGTGQYGGFVQLTGEVGTGKTTIIRKLLAQKLDSVDVAMIHNPRLSEQEFVETICDELHVPHPPKATLKTLVDALNAHLLRVHAAGRRAVLIIDEAQNLLPGVLEQVRLLTNLETDKEKLLRIMLVGQPELIELLARPDLRQLASRITARYHLRPLSMQETREYIEHRMRVAGSITPVFSATAIQQIYRATKGIPRQINILCDRSLLGAYARGVHQVTPEVVQAAVKETVGQLPAPSAAEVMASGSLLQRIRAVPLVWVEISVAMLALVIMLLLLVNVLGGRSRARAAHETAAVEVPAAPAPSPVAAPVKPVVAAPVALSGSAALAQLRRSAQPLSALTAALIRLWDPTARVPAGEKVCRALGRVSLGCYRGNGDWSELTVLNRPVLLTLNLGNNERFYVLLRSLGDDTVVLEGADGPHVYALGQIDGLWTGEFFMLWYRPIDTDEVNWKSRGQPVQWVRRQLKEAGDATVEIGGARYDSALLNAVSRFQDAHGLLVNGVVNTRTLMALADLSAPPSAPTLIAGLNTSRTRNRGSASEPANLTGGELPSRGDDTAVPADPGSGE